MIGLKKFMLWTGWLGAVSLALFLAWSAGLDQVQQVECSLKDQACEAPIMDLVNQARGRSFLFSDFEEVFNTALDSEFPYLRVKSITNDGWGQLKVTLWQSSSRLTVMGPSDDKFVLDSSGGLSSPKDKDRLVEVELAPEIYEQLQANRGLPESLAKQLLAVAGQIESVKLNYQRIKLQSDQLLIVVLPGQTQIILELNRPELIKSLQFLSEELKKSDYAGIKEVDMRYKLPVLRDHVTI